MAGYRADHVGSFLRPPELLDARAAHAEGRIGDAELCAAEDRAILTILELQRQIGVDVYSDGEYRRGMWITGLPAAGQNPALVITGKLTPRRRITGVESAFLGAHASGPYKITIPSPTWYLRGYVKGTSDRVYPTAADALHDLTSIVHREVRALVEERVPYVQIDSIRYVFDYTDGERRREWQELGIDPDRAIDENVAADNAVVAGLAREGVRFGLHMCRGNNRSRWFAEGGYDRIAEKVFSQLDYDRFLLEYDSERAGGFAPLRYIPKGKTVVFGLISTKVPQLESPGDLLRRIDEAAKHVPIANLALSPQCGFASVAAGNEISWDDQRRKLALLVDTARRVWGG
jgi:5-methyltetrahydropteroyltriglutamate--homocysteine methyltransferase